MDCEVDGSGGLMPQILALTAPPGSRDLAKPQQQPQQNNQQQNNQFQLGITSQYKESLAAHPYFRRPGRGHNHDSCDACKEGGDLICCDLCPASFHLTCHDPPLEDEDIPTGDWVCHQCKVGGNEDDRTSVSSGKSNKSTKVCKRKEREEEKQGNNSKLNSVKSTGKIMNKTLNKVAKIASVSIKKDEPEKVLAGGREMEVSDTPLATLIRAAASINPQQFVLPYEMTLPSNFPGEPKVVSRVNGSRKGLAKKKPYELDNGLVPLPAKRCFQCNKSCRIGPLVPCDYCPLFYHLDCLDPPLTTPPSGQWMCPSHPEHFLDSAQLKSHGLTERVKLWDKFSGPIDQNAVKINFLKKIHRTRPSFRYKVKRVLRDRIRVPDAIKNHYKEPPDLMPPLPPSYLFAPSPLSTDVAHPYSCSVRNSPNKTLDTSCSSQSNFVYNNNLDDLSQSTIPNTPNEMEDDGRGTNVEIKEEPPEPPGTNSEVMSLEDEDAPEEPMEVSCKTDISPTRPTKDERDSWLSSMICFQSSVAKKLIAGNEGSNTPSESSEQSQCVLNGATLSSDTESRPDCMNGDVLSHYQNFDKSLKTSSRKISMKNMPQHLSQMNKKLQKISKKRVSDSKSLISNDKTSSELISDSLGSLALLLRKSVIGNQEVSLSHLDKSVVDILAWQRLKQMLDDTPTTEIKESPNLPARALLCPLYHDIYLNDWIMKDIPDQPSKQPVPMTYRIFNIGKGCHNHVDLSRFGHCNYISSKHATIVFDENTGHYELINYSEFGTKVDCVVYHSDVSDKTISQAPPPPLLQHVRAIISKRRKIAENNSPPSVMTNAPGHKFIRCHCKRKDTKPSSSNSSFSSESSSGWEGTAVLHHGSHITLGCLQFVFSIVEDASKADWGPTTVNTYEKFFLLEEEERELEEKQLKELKEKEIDKESNDDKEKDNNKEDKEKDKEREKEKDKDNKEKECKKIKKEEIKCTGKS